MIRSFRLPDTPLVSQLQASGEHLDLRRALLWSRSSLSAAMLVYLPFSRRGVRTLVMRENVSGAPSAGFLQYHERRGQPEADVIFCAPAIGGNKNGKNNQHIWHKLLNYLVVRLGERGCQRLYARLVDGAPELEVFWQLGFSAYARTRIYQREGLPPLPEPAKSPLWRLQTARDVWSVGQLYAAVTPKLVQQAENLPQSDYRTPYRDDFGRSIDRRYVWVEKDEVSASLRVIRGHHRCWLKLIVNPQSLEQADDLLRDALRFVPSQSEKIYVSVREYQSELEGAILRGGFTHLTTEMLMVKHTTVMVKKPVLKQIPAIEGIEARPTGTYVSAPADGLSGKTYAISHNRRS